MLEGANWPAHVTGQQVKRSFRQRRETADSQIPPEQHHRQVNAGLEVVEVAVEAVQLRVAVGHLLVDGNQFFVGGLEFFLGSFQLLVDALQLLIGGLQFLVGRLKFLVRGFVLPPGGIGVRRASPPTRASSSAMRRRKAATRVPGPLPARRAERPLPFDLWAPASDLGPLLRLLEQYQVAALLEALKRDNLNDHRPRTSILTNLHVLLAHSAIFLPSPC